MNALNQYPKPALQKNDTRAYWLIGIFSVVVFGTVTLLGRVGAVQVNLGFDVHYLAAANAVINSLVAVFLIAAIVVIKQKKYKLHKKLMLVAMGLSVLFLVFYIAYHLFSGEAKFGDTNHDNIVDEAEKAAAGTARLIYFIILGTHILLAGLVMPFVLFSAYRGLTGEYEKHKKLSRYTWPIWLYVAVTGPVVYLMINKYYS